MIYTEFTGKTVEDAVEKGLSELGLTRENADIRVLEEGKKKLFGAVKARVEIAAKDCQETCEACDKDGAECEETVAPVIETASENATDGERTVVFLEGLFKLLKITACTELVAEGEKVEINVTAANTTAIIGKHGVMLDAIQTLAGAVANTGRDDYKRVVVDCENYRENREATLNKLAENLAAKALRLGKKIQLEPMNPYERRIIHAALSENEDVKTESEGKEPNRYIVIVPNNLEDPDAPAIPARTERDRRGRGGYGNRGDRGRDRGFGGRNDRGRGGKGGYGKKSFNRDRKPSSGGSTGGTSLKTSNDFFGIFLGNSGNSEE
ncbi:MAG: protein jag [Clostridiales bacterium]|nr:protein jag [Clostridiales bacterium]